MEVQLMHLLDMGSRPGITVQVITETTHCGLSGAFNIAETPQRRVAYLETIADGMTAEDADVITDLDLRFDVLRTDSLRGRESMALLEKVLEAWAD